MKTKRCCLIDLANRNEAVDNFSSNFGLKLVALPNEEWPACDFISDQERNRYEFFNGKALPVKIERLFFLCQINLTEAPYVPKKIEDIKLISIFINPDFISSHPYIVRAYKSLEGLQPVTIPEGCTFEEGRKIKWSEVKKDIEDDGDDVDEEGESDKRRHMYHSKLGGYPTILQDESSDDFVLQINSEDDLDLMFGDSGILYLSRSRLDGSFHIDISYY